MIAAEILGRILTGADAYADPHRGGCHHVGIKGVVIIALSADVFQQLESYASETGELVRARALKVRAVPTRAVYPGGSRSRRS